MKINQYLELHKLTDAEFARRISVTRAMVGRYRKGQRPSPSMAARIETITDGEVRAMTLIFGDKVRT
jgi:transcriptional regulator with XRE-family HTH domain